LSSSVTTVWASNNNKEDASTTSDSTSGEPIDWLGPNSVVLITGAAGFLGSELALALHRTYSPKKMILIDRMGMGPQTTTSSTTTSSSSTSMSLFEFQRQRTFQVLQTLGVSGQFYRADFRPMIPEYYDAGETPVLDHIFRNHPDITHVVHLADPFPHSALALTCVYREKEVPKAGMMETLLEQLAKVKREGKTRVPHFTYASSSEVYPANNKNSTRMKLEERMTLSTPSSLRGASKLMDEVLAKLYHDTHDIYSVGLRFFSVYGPWSAPGSTLFELAERAVTGSQSTDTSSNNDDDNNDYDKDIRDYVYIDDAVDAIMAAMQFRPLGDDEKKDDDKIPPVVINVASGQGTSLENIANMMQEYFPHISGTSKSKKETTKSSSSSSTKGQHPSVSVGSTKRAQELLGFQPRVSLRDGIIKLLAWHYDRAFPYGGQSSSSQEKTINFIASRGIVSCSPHDKECLRAAPVFPCASECSHEGQCTSSFYDAIVGWTQALTAKCETVLYTVALEDSLTSLPSAQFRINPSSQSFLDGNCNLAFVSESSHLVQTVQRASRINLWGDERLLKYGEWILVPVSVSTAHEDDDLEILKLLPKLSPGLFFGPHTKRAIYTDPNILLDSIPRLLREASAQPFMEDVQGATALLIGKGKSKSYFTQNDDDDGPSKQVLPRQATRVQNAAYRMVRIAVSEELLDEFIGLLDSRWMVHTLQSDDSRLFRCDVYGEVVQWQVDTDRAALEFILGLHDMWTRVMAKQAGDDPWWIGDGVVTVPEGKQGKRRQLQEDNEDKGEGGAENKEDEEQGGDKNEDEENEPDERVMAADEKIEASSNTDDDVVKKIEEHESDEGKVGGFGRKAEGVAQQEVNADGKTDFDPGDDDRAENDVNAKAQAPVIERDLSSYDTWMGVLSSSSTKYFVRIVPSHEVGVVSLDEYKVDQKEL
jgi:UDP-glucuronate 4-epimerase